MALRRKREDEDLKALAMKLMALKRNREDGEDGDLEALAMRLLSRIGKPPSRTFKCKTCDQEFNSFQALGGHRASHSMKSDDPFRKQKTHFCKRCGAEFAKGQALGGHMRKHRSTIHRSATPSPTTSEVHRSATSSPTSPSVHSEERRSTSPTSEETMTARANVAVSEVSDLKEISGSKRMRGLDFDLNILASEEDNYLTENYSKPLGEENYPTKNNYLEEDMMNYSKVRHEDLTLEEDNYLDESYRSKLNRKLNGDLRYKKLNLECITLQGRDDLNLK